MGIRDLWRRLTAKQAGPVSAPRAATQSAGGGVIISSPQQLEEYLRAGAGAVTNAGLGVTPESALRVAAVYACVRIISGAAATMPVHVKRRVDERTRNNVDEHPVQRLLSRRPNRWMTPSSFRRMVQSHVLLRGNAYALKVRDFRGDPVELIPLHPDRVTLEQGDDLAIRYRYRRNGGQEVQFAQEDIFHLVGLTLDGFKGVSVLTYARETIGLAAAISRHGSAFFKNGTQLGAVLKHKGQLGSEGIERLAESLEEFRGSENAQKTLILEEDMSFEKLGMSSVDAQFVEAISATRTDIAMFFGVPPHMIGDTAKSTSWGSGIEQQSIGFVAYTLEDWLTAWEQTIDRDLIGDADPSLYARFNRAALVRGDIKTRYGAYAVGRQWGWLSANDVRATEDLNPIEGGDEYLVPLNMTAPDAGETVEEPPDEPSQAA